MRCDFSYEKSLALSIVLKYSIKYSLSIVSSVTNCRSWFYVISRSEIIIFSSENVIFSSLNIIFSSPIVISGSEIVISGSLYHFYSIFNIFLLYLYKDFITIKNTIYMDNKQHIQLPKEMAQKDLTPQDQLVYLAIKKYMNKDTKTAYPSLSTLKNDTGASIVTIRKCIDSLIEKDYISVMQEGRRLKYKFNDYNSFEPFSYDFLDRKDITFTEKSYLAASQQYMFTDVEGLGKMSYTNKELSDKINMSESTISKCNRALVSKDYLQILKSSESGGIKDLKIFQLDKLGQAIIWKLKEHDDAIKENKEDIKELNKKVDALEKRLEDRDRLINKLLSEKSSATIDYSF